MPHSLCFTDLSLTTTVNTMKSLVATDADSTPPSAPACAAGEGRDHSTTFFVRDEDKKSSFALGRPVALVYESGPECRNDGNARNSAPRPANGDGNADKEREHGIHESQLFERGSQDAGEKFALTAAASITSCISAENSDSASQEKYLFGGFELITNVGTVEVHAVRSTDASTSAAEAYLTTCKGVPMRDLPRLSTNPLCTDGTNIEELCQEIKHGLDESTMEPDIFYKFIFVLPGGPKPMERVRLKFARTNVSPVQRFIIVRTLKVKGRLSDSMPKKISERQSLPQSTLPIGFANFFPGMPSVEGKNNMSGLASMMAMIGGNGVIGTSSMESSQINRQQHQMRQKQLQSCNPQNSQHQRDNNHQQDKNQAEIMSSIAGLGIFLRSSEERMANKLEMMLTGMEMRVTKRLDGLAARLDAIEQSIVHESIKK